MNDFFQSRAFSRLIGVLGVLLIALLIFWAGTAVGAREARFSRDWDDNYVSQFGGPGSPFVPQGSRDDAFMSAHGAFGEIIGVRLPRIVVKGASESEKTVLIGGGTVIRRAHSPATMTDLATGETVIVIGAPDSQGDIEASLIRIVMPSATDTPNMQPSGGHDMPPPGPSGANRSPSVPPNNPLQ